MCRASVRSLIVLGSLLFAASALGQHPGEKSEKNYPLKVAVHTIVPPRPTASDPALRGEQVSVPPSLQALPPERRKEEAYALLSKTGLLPRTSFALKPGESKEVPMSQEQPVLL